MKKGDTLSALSRRFGVGVPELAAANQLSDPGVLCVGQALVIPTGASSPDGRSIVTNGYVSAVTAATLAESAPYLTFLSPFSFRTDAAGTLTRDYALPDGPLPEGVAGMLTVTNLRARGGFDSAAAHAVLTDGTAQAAFLENLDAILTSGPWAGVGLDFEYIYPFDRESYNQFLRLLADRLHEKGLLLMTALAPKTSDGQQGLLYTAHDYAAHGQSADYTVLMTYEWGYTYGPPMAVAPLPQVRRVLSYAVERIPREKILLGVPNYGYDWTLPFQQGRAARALSNTAAVALAGREKVAIHLDPAAQAPYFRYRDDGGALHEVWFEDARSLRAKYALVGEYGLAGVSWWNLNRLFRTNFLVLESLYPVEKPGRYVR